MARKRTAARTTSVRSMGGPSRKRTTEAQRAQRKKHREIHCISSLCFFLCALCASVVRLILVFLLVVVARKHPRGADGRRHRRVRSLHRPPDHFIEEQVVRPVFLRQVELL